MLRKFQTIVLIAWLLTGCVYAQNQRIDSLKQLLSRPASSTARLDQLLQLCREKYSLNSDSLLHFATTAKKLAIQLNEPVPSRLADYYITYSLLAKNKEDSVIALADAQLAGLQYKGAWKEVFARFLMLKGFALLRANKSKEAIDVFLSLLKDAEETNDIPVVIELEMHIGNAYSTITQYAETLSWNTKALALCRPGLSLNDDELYAAALVRQGIVYLHLFEMKQYRPYADSSRMYAARALDICKQQEILFLLCQSLILTGYNLSYSNDPVQAEAYLKEGLAVRKKIADPIYIISDISVLGTFYAKTAQPAKGIAIVKEGIDVFNQHKMPAQLLVLLNNALAQNYQVAGDYVKYSETLSNLISLKDSIYKINSAEALSKLQAQYEVQKKENIIIQQKLDIVRQNSLFYGIIILFGFVLLAIYIVYRNYRKRQKVRMERVMKEQEQKETIAIMQAQEKERKRIAADLHDNLGAYAAAISANVRSFKDTEAHPDRLTSQIEENVSGMVNQLSDTIWVLKKESQLLTEVSDRFKIWMQRLMKSYPDILYDVEEEIDEQVALSPAHALNLFYMLQECVNNALRHSGCNSLFIHFVSEPAGLQISVTDNGKGFDPLHIKAGNGLSNLQQRAENCNWQVRWVTEPVKGTTVFINSILQ